MNFLLRFAFLLFLSASSLFAQRITVQPIYPGGSGNIGATNPPGSPGLYLTSDGTNAYWATVVATSTNPVPSYVLTNNQSTASTLQSSLRVVGAVTNANATRLEGTVTLTTLSGGLVGVNSSGQVVLTNVVAANIIVADATFGSDSTGARQLMTKPVATLTNALALAQSGDTILVRPGTYTFETNQSLPLKSNVKWYFEPGARINDPNDPDRDLSGENGTPLFHDFNGAVTNCGVYGYGFFWSSNTVGAVLCLTNIQSKVYFECDTLQMVTAWPGIEYAGGDLTFNIRNKIDTVYDGFGTSIPFDYGSNVVNGFIKNWISDDSLYESGTPFRYPGSVYIRFDYAEKRGVYNTQISGFEVPDGVIIEGGYALFNDQGAISGTGPTGSGTLRNVKLVSNSTNRFPIIGRPTFTGTAITLDNCDITGPANVDPIYLSNSTGFFITRNTRITAGSGATNMARSSGSAETWVVNGVLTHNKPIGSSATVVLTTSETNQMINTRFKGASYGENLTLSSNLTTADILASGDITFPIGSTLTAENSFLTDVEVSGTATFSGLLPSKVIYLNGGGVLSTVTGSGAYVKADGTTGDPAGSGTMTTVKTNGVNVSTSVGSVNFLAGTNVVLDTTNTAGAVDIRINAAGGGSSSSNYVALGVGDLFNTNTIITDAFQARGTVGLNNATITNRLALQSTWSSATNYTLDWATYDIINLAPTGALVIAQQNGPGNTITTSRKKTIYLLTDNTLSYPAAWNTFDGRPITLASGVTNVITVEYTGQTNYFISVRPVDYDVAAGWGQVLTTNGNTVSIVLTNRASLIATNAGTASVDFSNTANIQVYNFDWHLTNKCSIWPTNLVTGRTIEIYFPTNSISYDVTVTNLAGNPVRWNFNVATNGSYAFTKTNTLAARVFLTVETNSTITAEMGYYR